MRGIPLSPYNGDVMSAFVCLTVSDRAAVPDAPAEGSIAVIVIVVVVIIVAVLVITVLVIIILYLYIRNKRLNKKGLYSPRHFSEHSSLGANTLELKYSRTSDPEPASTFSAATMEKEAEAEAEAELAAPQPASTTPTEGRSPPLGAAWLVLAWCCVAVLDRMKAVAMESFRDHVAQKHNERDKGFEAEYQVRCDTMRKAHVTIIMCASRWGLTL